MTDYCIKNKKRRKAGRSLQNQQVAHGARAMHGDLASKSEGSKEGMDGIFLTGYHIAT